MGRRILSCSSCIFQSPEEIRGYFQMTPLTGPGAKWRAGCRRDENLPVPHSLRWRAGDGFSVVRFYAPLPAMSWWGEQNLEPAPVAEPVADRMELALQRVREIKSSLDTLDAEMLTFKTKHRVRTN